MDTIAILIPSLKKGGAEKQAVLLKNALSDHYHVYFILFNAELGHEQELIELGHLDDDHLVKLQGSLVGKLWHLHKILRKHKVRALFTYLAAPNFFGSLIGRMVGVPNIYTGMRSACLESSKRFFEKVASRMATKVIANSHAGELFFNKYGVKNTCTISNCYINFHYVSTRTERQTVGIVTVARFTEEKDYYTALKSVQRLRDEGLAIHYTIIGYGTLEAQIRGWIKELGLQDTVSVVINPKNIFGYLEQQDIYLSTSLFEGTSNSVMEALDAELPVVATDAGDNKYLVIDGQNGFIHSAGDVEGISMSLKRLAMSGTLREKFGKRGKNLLRENHSMERFRQSYLNLLK